MKKNIKVWTIRLVILAIIGIAIYKWGVPFYKAYSAKKEVKISVPTAKVSEGRLVVSFIETGTLDARKSVPVVSSIWGKIIKLVSDGVMVSKGALIAQLDTSDIEKQVRDRKLEYENALADIERCKVELELLKEQNKTELEQSETQLEFNKAELARVQEQLAKKTALAKEKIIAGSEVEQAELDVRSKELQVKTGEMALELKKKEIQSSESQKEAELSNKKFIANMAKISLDEAEMMMEKAIIRAPASGMVVLAKVRDESSNGRRSIREGDNVNPRRMICQLPDLSSMLVKVPVGEANAPRLFLGMPTVIRLEAVPGKLYHGTVEKIASLAVQGDPNSDVGSAQRRKNFTVTVAIKEHDSKVMKPGMTASVEFIEKIIPRTLFVPISAVFEKHGKTYVYIKDGEDYRQVSVKTGISNDKSVCILEGVRKGDVVALRDPILALQEATRQMGKARNTQQAVPIPGM